MTPKQSEIERRKIGEEIIESRMNGNTLQEIAQTFDLTVSQVHYYLDKVNSAKFNIKKMSKRDALILEISQEGALSELAQQLKQYTDNYADAETRGDEKAMYAWSQRRIDILKEMMKVTGLYDKARKEAEREEPEPIEITWKMICPECKKKHD